MALAKVIYLIEHARLRSEADAQAQLRSINARLDRLEAMLAERFPPSGPEGSDTLYIGAGPEGSDGQLPP